MEKYEVVPLNAEEVAPGMIPGVALEFGPVLGYMLRDRRLIQFGDSRMYQWEAKWGSLSSPWQRYGPIVQLKCLPVKTTMEPKKMMEETELNDTAKACLKITEDILERLDVLRLKAMGKKTPVTPINDCIHQVRIVQGDIFDRE